MKKFGMHGSVVKRTISGYDLIRTYIPLIRFSLFTFVAFFSPSRLFSLRFVLYFFFFFRTFLSNLLGIGIA